MNRKTHLYSILCILIVGFFYLIWLDYKNNFLLIWGDIMIPLNPPANLKYLSTWIDYNNGTVILSSLHFLILLYAVLYKLTTSITLIQALHIYIIHVAGSIGVYYLANVLFPAHPQKKSISLLSGFTYLISPAFLNMYFAYPAIGFVPLALAFFADGLRQKRKYLFALFIGIIVSFGNLPDPHPRPFFLIITPILLLAAFEILFHKTFRKTISYLVLVFLYIFLFNAWYFLGLAANSILKSNILLYAKNIPFVSGNRFPDEGTALMEKMYRLFHDGITAAYAKLYLTNVFMVILHFIPSILAFSSLLFIKKKNREETKSLLFLLLMALGFLFLSKSVNPPFGIFYRLALEQIPLFRVFRTTAYFILGTAISFSILIPFSIIEIKNAVDKRSGNSNLSKIVAFILFALVVLNSYPIILGHQAFYQPDPAVPGTHGLKVPKDDYRLNDFLKKDPTDSKILSLPIDPGYELLKKRPQYFGIPKLPFILERPLINQRYRDFSSSISLPLLIQQEIIKNTPQSRMLVNLSNIRYLLIKNNAVEIDLLKNSTIILNSYRYVTKFGDLELYENSDYFPHLYTPKKIVVTDEIPEQFIKILSQEPLPKGGAVYFTPQNLKTDADKMRGLNPKIGEASGMEYKKISQTKYRVLIKNAAGIFPLVFNETFHNGWKLYIGNPPASKQLNLGKFVSLPRLSTVQNDNLPDGSPFETFFKLPYAGNHSMVNGYGNLWLINTAEVCSEPSRCSKNSDGTYNLGLVIEFLPEKISFFGSLIATTTVIATFGAVLYSMLRTRRST